MPSGLTHQNRRVNPSDPKVLQQCLVLVKRWITTTVRRWCSLGPRNAAFGKWWDALHLAYAGKTLDYRDRAARGGTCRGFSVVRNQ